MKAVKDIFAAAMDWRARAVLARNAAVYFRTWYIGLLPPALEPLLFLLAFGLGLGAFVTGLTWQGRRVDYLDYLAPGLLAYASFTTPFFQALYAAYVRMHYQKAWDGLLTSQVELRHVVWGEILWAGALGAVFATIVASVLALCHAAGYCHLHWWLLPILPLVSFAAGCAFATVGLFFTAIVPSIDHMNLPTFLVGFPVGFLSDTYFPVRTDHALLAAVVAVNPLHHLAEMYRAVLLGGDWIGHAGALAALLAGIIGFGVPLVMRLMRRRVLGG